MNYSIGDEKLERVDLDKIKSKLSEDDERKLSTDMRELYNRLQPTDAIGKNRHKLVQKLEKLFNDEWPGHDIRVHLFGSSGNLLCSDDSDGMYNRLFQRRTSACADMAYSGHMYHYRVDGARRCLHDC